MSRLTLTIPDFAEAKNENGVELFRAFLARVLNIHDNIYIQSAHRLGKFAAGKQRPMIARIPVTAERSLIFRSANRLRDTKHFISSQMPPSRAERKQFALTEFKAKKADVTNKAVLRQDKLFVKGKLQTQFLRPRLPDTSIAIPNDTSMVAESREKQEGGNTFK